MDEAEVRAIESLKNLSILDEHDPNAKAIISNTAATSVAEAEDMLRLHELLHRKEYKPVAGVRYPCESGVCVRVYFARLDET
jgi:hypothetical protein